MGLYSTNRVVQLANYNNIDFEHIDTDESAPNLLESSIMLHEADQQMFDTLIGLDFVEAHNEQAMLEDSNNNNDGTDNDNADDTTKDTAKSSAANKAVSKNIFQKIIDIIQKAILIVKNAIRTAINKVREFINNTANKAVAARFKNYDWSNFKEFKVKSDTFGIVFFGRPYATFKRIDDLTTIINTGAIDNTSAEDLEAKIAELDKFTKIANEILEEYKKKEDTEDTVTVDIAKDAVNIISKPDKIISDLNKSGNEATTALLKLKQRVGKPKGDDPKTVNNLYSFATKASKAVTKLVQAAINRHVAMLKIARSVAFKIGRGEAKASDNNKEANTTNNNKEANTTNNNESAYDSFVGSISDIYVENYFADLFD